MGVGETQENSREGWPRVMGAVDTSIPSKPKTC